MKLLLRSPWRSGNQLTPQSVSQSTSPSAGAGDKGLSISPSRYCRMDSSSPSPFPTERMADAMHRTWCHRKLSAVTSKYTNPSSLAIRIARIFRKGFLSLTRAKFEKSWMPRKSRAAFSIFSIEEGISEMANWYRWNRDWLIKTMDFKTNYPKI